MVEGLEFRVWGVVGAGLGFMVQGGRVRGVTCSVATALALVSIARRLACAARVSNTCG